MLSWKRAVIRYQEPMLRKSIWQVVNTLVPYLALCGLMIWTLHVSYWLTLAVSVATAGFMIRIFIIFHDCGHGSFFRSQHANHVLGFVTGVLTFTPYLQWRQKHALHHATSGDLDRRGRRERLEVHWTNGALLLIAVVMSLTVGLKAYVLIQLPVMTLTGTVGLWLFYVQHQFEGVYWKRRESWGFAEAALLGSSFYRLPRILQWFSGNIGFHHIHHLSPRIPNYNLEPCHRADPLFQRVKPITLLSSLRSFTYRLWDEQRGRLTGYRALRELRRQQAVPFRSSSSASSSG